MTAKVRTCLWFPGNGEEAARFYVSLLPGSAIEGAFRPKPDEPAIVVDFMLAGTPYQVLNGPPMFQHNEAASISVLTDDQAETDRLWEALTADGGSESQCGWLKDRFGVSWQIVPRRMTELFMDADKAASGRAMAAMMTMRKLDIVALEAAFAGKE